MRAHGTRACYVFGPEPGSDRSRGCRCEPCRDANRVYARDRDRATRRPDVVVTPAYVDASEAADHLRWLRSQGVGLRTVSARSGVSRSTLHQLAGGTRARATEATIDRILAVGRHAAHGAALVEAKETWRLLDDLLAHGFTRTFLARSLGSAATNPALQISRDRVTAENARKVKDLHRRLLLPVIVERENMAARRRYYRQAA